jgi:cytochrome c biogenesis protein CcmG, thiol:disulfide interchange protein DsbE
MRAAGKSSSGVPAGTRVGRVALAFVALAVGALTSTSCSRGSALGAQTGVSEVDRPLPPLAGETVQGETARAADFRGEVLVVNVWATWCGPCRREQPALQRLGERFSDRGVAFLGLNYNDDPAAARAWVEEFGVSYPSISDPSGSFADDLGFVGLPDTYVVGRSGTIRFVVFGETSEQELAGLIEHLLAEG